MTDKHTLANAMLGCVGAMGLMLADAVLAQTPATTAPAAVVEARPARGPTPTPACGATLSAKNLAPVSRCFELRTYTVRPEGPGNIDLLHARFRDATARLFLKHGMTIIGFWQPVAMPDTFVYMLAYKDNATRDAQWAAFSSDPEWVETRARMSVNVGVVHVFMNATDYSPMK